MEWAVIPRNALALGHVQQSSVREILLAAWHSRSAMRAFMVLQVSMTQSLIVVAEGIRRSGLNSSSSERNLEDPTAVSGWSSHATHSTRRFSSSSGENAALVAARLTDPR